MIAADSSTLIDWLKTGPSERPDVVALRAALISGRLRLPPVVVTEVCSYVLADERLEGLLALIEILPIQGGYWRRAGDARARLRGMGLKAKLADALVAQACIDADVPLATNDADFRHFVTHCGLRLAT